MHQVHHHLILGIGNKQKNQQQNENDANQLLNQASRSPVEEKSANVTKINEATLENEIVKDETAQDVLKQQNLKEKLFNNLMETEKNDESAKKVKIRFDYVDERFDNKLSNMADKIGERIANSFARQVFKEAYQDHHCKEI